LKKSNREKKPIKSIKILKKKPTGLVRFQFISLKPKIPKKTGKKPSQTGKSRAKLV
jgi:hypothetical protein